LPPTFPDFVIRGVAEETIGNLTSSGSWRESGQHDKEEAIVHMREAHHDPETQGRYRGVLQTEGKVERTAGWLTGCEGMKHDGERKIQAAIEK
jgi:uncharacterized protein YjbJ (UPF0337 family)